MADELELMAFQLQRYGLHKDDTHTNRVVSRRTHGSLLKDDAQIELSGEVCGPYSRMTRANRVVWRREHGPCAKMTRLMRDTEKIRLTQAQGDTQNWVWMIVSTLSDVWRGSAGQQKLHQWSQQVPSGPRSIRLVRRPQAWACPASGCDWCSLRALRGPYCEVFF